MFSCFTARGRRIGAALTVATLAACSNNGSFPVAPGQVSATSAPTSAPTTTPATTAPTSAPTTAPTLAPTTAPTSVPTAAPTTAATLQPTTAPSTTPTSAPTSAATSAPTMTPTTAPTAAAVVTNPTAVSFPMSAGSCPSQYYSAMVSVSESGYSGNFTVTNPSPSEVTVSPSSGTSFTLTDTTSGTTRFNLTFTDSNGKSVQMPVTFNTVCLP